MVFLRVILEIGKFASRCRQTNIERKKKLNLNNQIDSEQKQFMCSNSIQIHFYMQKEKEPNKKPSK